jgi:hypothetical protein
MKPVMVDLEGVIEELLHEEVIRIAFAALVSITSLISAVCLAASAAWKVSIACH